MLRILAIFLSLCSLVMANPQGPNVVHNNATFATDGNQLVITADNNAIIHWDQFSIGKGETTQFSLPNASASILNRVVGNQASLLQGMLLSNGNVYLINPQGVCITRDGIVDTAAFFSSTLDFPDNAFINNESLHLTGDSTASILNQGTIRANGGDVTFIAARVINEGSIEAKKGAFRAGVGLDVYFHPDKRQKIHVKKRLELDQLDEGFTNEGFIEALQAEVCVDGNLYHKAINLKSKIDLVEDGITGPIIFSANDGTIHVENCRFEVDDLEMSGNSIVIHNSDFDTETLHLNADNISVGSSMLSSDTILSLRGKGAIHVEDSSLSALNGKVLVGREGERFKTLELVGGLDTSLIEGESNVEIFANKLKLEGNKSSANILARGDETLLIDAKEIEINANKSTSWIKHMGLGKTVIRSGSTRVHANNGDALITSELGGITLSGSLTLQGSESGGSALVSTRGIHSPIVIRNGSIELVSRSGGNAAIETFGRDSSIELKGCKSLQLDADQQTAYIKTHSKGSITLDVDHNIDLLGGKDASSYVQAKGPITIRGHDLFLRGGSGEREDAFSYIEADGKLSIECHDLKLKGGSNTSNSSEAYIKSTGNDHPIAIKAQSVELFGGSGEEASAMITTLGNQSTISIKGRTYLAGGSGEGSVAEIYTTGKAGIFLENSDLSSPISLEGGEGYISYAAIYTATEGDIKVKTAGGLGLKGGSGNSMARAHITSCGNISIKTPQEVLLEGGFGEGMCDANIVALDENNTIAIHASKLKLKGGAGLDSSAAIHTVGKGSRIVISGGLDLESGVGDRASVEIVTEGGGPLHIGSTNPSDKICIREGLGRYARVKIGSEGYGDVRLNAGGVFSLENNPLSNSDGIHIISAGNLELGSVTKDIVIDGVEGRHVIRGQKGLLIESKLSDVVLKNATTVTSQGMEKGLLEIRAGKNVYLDDNTSLSAPSFSKVRLVCDTLFSDPYQQGSGRIVTSKTSRIDVQGGPIELYTSSYEYNDLQGLLNNHLFEVDAHDKPFFYYPHSSYDGPYTVYYKLPINKGLDELRSIGMLNVPSFEALDFHLPTPLYRPTGSLSIGSIAIKGNDPFPLDPMMEDEAFALSQ